MSYSKTTWKTGDTITAQLLNHAEDGIAANDAAIAAIPAGVQLYGPYYASGDKTISANSKDDIALTTMEDINGISVIPPSGNAVVLFAQASAEASAASTAALMMTNIEAPVFEEEWIPAHITVLNGTDSEKAVRAAMTLYSTVEFPQE